MDGCDVASIPPRTEKMPIGATVMSDIRHLGFQAMRYAQRITYHLEARSLNGKYQKLRLKIETPLGQSPLLDRWRRRRSGSPYGRTWLRPLRLHDVKFLTMTTMMNLVNFLMAVSRNLAAIDQIIPTGGLMSARIYGMMMMTMMINSTPPPPTTTDSKLETLNEFMFYFPASMYV